MVCQVENRMVVDAAWDEGDEKLEGVPTCEGCGEKIRQFRALHIHHGNIWLCDQCVEDAKEVTGW